MTVIDFFIFDPILRGPLFACALLGALGAVIGVLVVFRQQSLVGETLSHACYPGMVLGAIVAEAALDKDYQSLFTLSSFLGAAVSSIIAAKMVQSLVVRHKVPSDSALSCILSTTFAAGLLLVSAVQPVYPTLWRSLQALLMGQAATMRDQYVLYALLLSVASFAVVAIFRRSLKVTLFDADFARLSHLTSRTIESLFLVILVATVIVSVRLMGVVLMSAVLIFPAVCARLLTSKFEKILAIAAYIGGACGFSGVMISHQCAAAFRITYGRSVWLPSGPLIALLLAGCFFIVLLFSPSEGLVIRAWRRFVFVRRCQRENLLKMMWKECFRMSSWTITEKHLREVFPLPGSSMKKVLKGLQRKGFVVYTRSGNVEMTSQGILMGRKLVRLHRLWELYLVEYCGMPKERVHPRAEEMEHILTPEIEKELSALLRNPSFDPHSQPIPSSEEDLLTHG